MPATRPAGASLKATKERKARTGARGATSLRDKPRPEARSFSDIAMAFYACDVFDGVVNDIGRYMKGAGRLNDLGTLVTSPGRAYKTREDCRVCKAISSVDITGDCATGKRTTVQVKVSCGQCHSFGTRRFDVEELPKRYSVDVLGALLGNHAKNRDFELARAVMTILKYAALGDGRADASEHRCINLALRHFASTPETASEVSATLLKPLDPNAVPAALAVLKERLGGRQDHPNAGDVLEWVRAVVCSDDQITQQEMDRLRELEYELAPPHK